MFIFLVVKKIKEKYSIKKSTISIVEQSVIIPNTTLVVKKIDAENNVE